MSESYSEAALRHSVDADHLATGNRLDGAGYLIGFTVECAIKSKIELTRPPARIPRVHLPDLVDKAKRALEGRRNHHLFKILDSAEFMRGWQTDVRYAKDGTVDREIYQQWRQDADRVLAAADLRRRQP